MGQAHALPPRLRLLLATADTATERNDRVLGVQCILQIFAGFDRAETQARHGPRHPLTRPEDGRA